MTYYQQVFEEIEHAAEKVVVLVPTKRLARQLATHYMLQTMCKVMPAPDIYSLTEWIQQQWHTLTWEKAGLPEQLNKQQAALLWRQLARQQDTCDVAYPDELAKEAENAYQLMRQWQRPIKELIGNTQEEVRVFTKLADGFMRCCKQLHSIDAIDVWQELINRSDFQAKQPRKIIFYAFDDVTPMMAALQSKLLACGHDVCSMNNSQYASAVRVPFADEATQYQQVFYRAKQAALNKKNVGIIVPELSKKRREILRIAEDIFTAEPPMPYTLSSGDALNTVPIIEHALALISLVVNTNASSNSPDTILAVLTSAYSADFPSTDIYQFHTWLLKQGVITIGAADCLSYWQIFSETGNEECQIQVYLQKLKNIHIKTTELKKQAPQFWATWFADLLLMLGWPTIAPNSTEYQAIMQLHQAFEQLVSLTMVQEHLSAAEAISWLQNYCSESVFQIEGKDEQIQILGQLEGAGLEFDNLWILDLTDSIWPAKAMPNALLPLSLQKQYKMPHADADREYNFTKLLRQRYQMCAKEVYFCYPLYHEDKQLAMSPILSDLAVYDIALQEIFSNKNNYVVGVLDCIDDLSGYPSERGKLPAAVSVLNDYSMCAFRGYAKNRLGAIGLNITAVGISPHITGYLMHEVLANIWRKLHDQAGLLALNDAEKKMLIKKEVEQFVSAFIEKQVYKHSAVIYELEKEKIAKMIDLHFVAETKRAPFSVKKIESPITLTLNHYEMKFRIDRVDETEVGDVIIDYKSTDKTISEWFGDRPYAPQLPLYTLADDSISGIAYYQVTSDAAVLKGIAVDKVDGLLSIEKAKRYTPYSDFSHQINFWRQVCTDLLKQYQAGDATINPKNGMQTCRLCDLQSLCRVTEYLES